MDVSMKLDKKFPVQIRVIMFCTDLSIILSAVKILVGKNPVVLAVNKADLLPKDYNQVRQL